jgi:flagellar transcriptional activator FlhD
MRMPSNKSGRSPIQFRCGKSSIATWDQSSEGADVKTDQLLQEIRETNMTYLVLAQTMIREDKPQAMFRLGISEEVATLLEQLSIGQILKIASSNMLVCCFRFENRMVWDLLTSHGRDLGVEGVHAAILTAGPMPQAA